MMMKHLSRARVIYWWTRGHYSRDHLSPNNISALLRGHGLATQKARFLKIEPLSKMLSFVFEMMIGAEIRDSKTFSDALRALCLASPWDTTSRDYLSPNTTPCTLLSLTVRKLLTFAVDSQITLVRAPRTMIVAST